MLDNIIDDLILLSGGDINEMEKIIKGEENENNKTKYNKRYNNINQTKKIELGDERYKKTIRDKKNSKWHLSKKRIF